MNNERKTGCRKAKKRKKERLEYATEESATGYISKTRCDTHYYLKLFRHTLSKTKKRKRLVRSKRQRPKLHIYLTQTNLAISRNKK